MRSISVFFALLFLLPLLRSCHPAGQTGHWEQELLDTDRAFSRMSATVGMQQAFLEYCAADGVLLRPGSHPIMGKEAVTGLLASTDDSSFELTWEPHFARASASGDLGYTYGIYSLRPSDADTLMKGTYVSIWLKEDGEWKWVLDTGNQGLGPGQ
jgi:ketosteroid isomerase-like protein